MLTLIRCGITAAMLLSTSLPCDAQSVQATSWRDVFDKGFRDLEVLGRVERINVNSQASLEQFYGRCEVGAPDSVVLIGRSKYSHGEGIDFGWLPSFTAWALEYREGRPQRIAAPSKPDTLKVRITYTICGYGDHDPHSFVAEYGDRYVLMDVPSTVPPFGMIWFFAEGADGRLSELRWSPVLKRVENVARARARWTAAKWRQQAVSNVLIGSINVGMTPEMVREAWGDPKDINRTTTAFAVHEQWVYGSGTYVYMVNGRVTAIQQ